MKKILAIVFLFGCSKGSENTGNTGNAVVTFSAAVVTQQNSSRSSSTDYFANTALSAAVPDTVYYKLSFNVRRTKDNLIQSTNFVKGSLFPNKTSNKLGLAVIDSGFVFSEYKIDTAYTKAAVTLKY